MSQNLHLDAFCQFWFDNFNSPIPPLPSKPSDLSITQLELLRLYDGGKLYQNLFSTKVDSGKLPADLENNIRKGLVWAEHKDLYRQHGYEFQAQEIERAQAELENKKIEAEIEASRQRQEAQRKAQQEFANKPLGARLMSEPLTQEQIINNQIKYHGHVGRS